VFTGLIFSILAIFLGSQLTVNSSVEIAKYFGVSAELIGLTMVAVGTSLPELAVSITAAIKRENKILLGNIIGSNIINVTLLGAIATAFSSVPNGQHKISLIALLIFTIGIFFLTKIYAGKEIPKAFGIILLASYTFYLFILLNN
jgi:cation:H+ antiporter